MIRVVFFSEPGNMHSSVLLERLAGEKDIEIVGVVTSSKVIHGKSPAKSFMRMIRRSGMTYFLMRMAEGIYMKHYRKFKLFGIDLLRTDVKTVRDVIREHGFREYPTDNLNDPEFIKVVRSLKPDVGVCCIFNQIFKQEIIDVPKFGCINVHRAKLPKNRGLSATFLVLAYGNKETGVTLHEIETGLDTGPIYHQETIRIDGCDTVFSLSQKMMQAMKDPLVDVIHKMAKGKIRPKPQTGDATQSSHPSREEVRLFLRKGRRLL